ncbi:hypothetical protein BOVATA_033460 [Babesia ovata]|uniref:Uncharacterized protein n=1 Tax=Babesia ovata TaxID=189622 RepID=A0A2H6KFS6_9APIC|nr:uncharacterized protein BOVATA_033460 [Babesia ovata]GBE61853.1 hypothetical protein BOVATA_033460 [Babesia ovata]
MVNSGHCRNAPAAHVGHVLAEVRNAALVVELVRRAAHHLQVRLEPLAVVRVREQRVLQAVGQPPAHHLRVLRQGPLCNIPREAGDYDVGTGAPQTTDGLERSRTLVEHARSGRGLQRPVFTGRVDRHYWASEPVLEVPYNVQEAGGGLHGDEIALRAHVLRRGHSEQLALLFHEHGVELGGATHQRDVGEALEVKRVARHSDCSVQSVVQRHHVATSGCQRGHLLRHLAHRHVVGDEVSLRFHEPVVAVQGEVRHTRVGEHLHVRERLLDGVDRAREQPVRIQPLIGELAPQGLVDMGMDHERRQAQVTGLLHFLNEVCNGQQPQSRDFGD